VVMPRSIREVSPSAFMYPRSLSDIILLSEEFDPAAEIPTLYSIDTVYTYNRGAEGKKFTNGYNSTGKIKSICGEEFLLSEGRLVAYFGSDPCPRIPSGVISILPYAFTAAECIRELTIPDTVKGMEPYALACLPDLQRVRIDAQIDRLPDGCFNNCTALGDVTLPESITHIGYRAFNECTSLKSISLPESLLCIGRYAFYMCKSLESIAFPEGLKIIDEASFYRCESLTSVTLPKSVESVEKYAFSECHSLLRVELGEVKKLGYAAFQNDTALTSVIMPPAPDVIENQVFGGCTGLRSLPIPDGIRHITATFFDTDATVLRISDSVTEISDCALSGFPALREIYLGKNLTSLGAAAFSGCKNLCTVHFERTHVKIGAGAFCSAASPLTVFYPGAAEDWMKITAPYIEERNKSYDSGVNGGAPGLSWDDYEVNPLGHKDGESFVIEVHCAADGETLICRGGITSRFVRSHSPYDTD